MGKIAPLVYYSNGERIVVGEAEVEGNKIIGIITNEEFGKNFFGEIAPGAFSIDFELEG